MAAKGGIPPPPDVQPIIDRLADYVARNGREFEQMVKYNLELKHQNPEILVFPYLKSDR